MLIYIIINEQTAFKCVRNTQLYSVSMCFSETVWKNLSIKENVWCSSEAYASQGKKANKLTVEVQVHFLGGNQIG